jgi:hypothetical protein
MSRLALESLAVQYPLVRHAVDGGWEFVPEAEALALRRTPLTAADVHAALNHLTQ